MASKLQKRTYTGFGAFVAALAIFGMGKGAGSQPPPANPVRVVHQTKVVHVKGKTHTVTKTVHTGLSPDCKTYITDVNQMYAQLVSWANSYGGVRDQLGIAYAAIETHNESALTVARIKLASMDANASDAVSTALELVSQIATDKNNCK